MLVSRVAARFSVGIFVGILRILMSLIFHHSFRRMLLLSSFRFGSLNSMLHPVDQKELVGLRLARLLGGLYAASFSWM